MGKNEFQTLPALPLKNTILFPGLLLPLSVGRESSLQAVEAALKTEEKEIILVAPARSSIGVAAAGRSLHDRHQGGDPQVVAAKAKDDGDPGARHRARGPGKARCERSLSDAQVSVYLPLPEDGGSEVEALSGALLELAAKAICFGTAAIGGRADPHAGGQRRSAAAGLSAGQHLQSGHGARTEAARGGDARRCSAADALLSCRTSCKCWNCGRRSRPPRATRCRRSSANTCCASNCGPFSRNWARKTPIRRSWTLLRERSEKAEAARRSEEGI